MIRLLCLARALGIVPFVTLRVTGGEYSTIALESQARFGARVGGMFSGRVLAPTAVGMGALSRRLMRINH